MWLFPLVVLLILSSCMACRCSSHMPRLTFLGLFPCSDLSPECSSPGFSNGSLTPSLHFSAQMSPQKGLSWPRDLEDLFPAARNDYPFVLFCSILRCLSLTKITYLIYILWRSSMFLSMNSGSRSFGHSLFVFISAFCFLPFSICLVYSFPSLIFNLIILFRIVIRTIKTIEQLMENTIGGHYGQWSGQGRNPWGLLLISLEAWMIENE